jgi:hypothetical protein
MGAALGRVSQAAAGLLGGKGKTTANDKENTPPAAGSTPGGKKNNALEDKEAEAKKAADGKPAAGKDDATPEKEASALKIPEGVGTGVKLLGGAAVASAAVGGVTAVGSTVMSGVATAYSLDTLSDIKEGGSAVTPPTSNGM